MPLAPSGVVLITRLVQAMLSSLGGISDPMNAPTTKSKTSTDTRIYLTAKSRMTSEANLRSQARFNQILPAIYSFYLIVISLLDLTQIYKFQNFSAISILCSIALFGIALFYQGQKLEERADNYKQCYLKLQQLEAEDLPEKEKNARYFSILEIYENQSRDDFDEMIFESWLRKQDLRNSNGPIILTNYVFVKTIFIKIFRNLFRLFLIIIPAILIILF